MNRRRLVGALVLTLATLTSSAAHANDILGANDCHISTTLDPLNDPSRGPYVQCDRPTIVCMPVVGVYRCI